MIGIDIVETNRFEKANPKMFNKVEIDYAFKHSDPHVHLAGFWAAKEAFFKAIGTGITSLSLDNIYVLHDEKQRPFLCVDEKIKRKLNIVDKTIEISISHTKQNAVAICIIK
ncbi:MAG: holo-ACP synthase [Christensenellales bacterium]